MGRIFLRGSIPDVILRTHFTLIANIIGSIVGFILVIACISYYWMQVKMCREREMLLSLAAEARSAKLSISEATLVCTGPVIRIEPNARRARRRLGDYEQHVALFTDEEEQKASTGALRSSLSDPPAVPPLQMRRIPYLPPISETSISVDGEQLSTHRSADEYSVRSAVERPAAVIRSTSTASSATEQKDDSCRDTSDSESESPGARRMVLPLRIPIDSSLAADCLTPVCVSARSAQSDITLDDEFREIDLPDDSTVMITPRDWISLSGDEVDGISIKLPDEVEEKESTSSLPL